MKVGIVMDPISGININKDSSFAMLLAAKSRGWDIYYMELADLFLLNDDLFASMRKLNIFDDPQHWFELGETTTIEVSKLDFILMRKDPPFDMEYVYATYLLEHAEKNGVAVFNKPASIRNANEKLFIMHFKTCITATQVCRKAAQIKNFIAQHNEVIIKPLDGMGGTSVFKTGAQDKNLNVIIETLTANETRFVMVQAYIAEISQGDKRILLIDGKPIPYALARIPNKDDIRGNLAKGGRGQGVELSDRDRWICDQVGPVLRDKGLIFAGIDIIGEYLTEINVTSPTCIRELDAIYNLNIADTLLDAIVSKLQG